MIHERHPHRWGFQDTALVIHDDYSIEMTGDRYHLCGYRMHELWPCLENAVGLKFTKKDLRTDASKHSIAPPHLHTEFYQALQQQFSPEQFSIDATERLIHSHGQTSVDEIFRVVFSSLPKVVDLVFYPEKEADVEAIIALASTHNICLIPYGGGTNVTNALKIPPSETRTVVSVDMRRLNKIEWIDEDNGCACVQAGISGLDLERALGARGFTMGHEPDSSEFSTLGGWIATHASGMKKNKYGNIEDIVENFTLLAPAGRMTLKHSFPRCSIGMNPMKMLMGNEGNVGIITTAIVKIRRAPECQQYQSVLFPTLEHGLAFLKELYRHQPLPASVRLMDNAQFTLGQALNPKVSFFKKIKKRFQKKWLTFKKFDLTQLAVLTALFEGSQQEVQHQEKVLLALAKKHGGLKAGAHNGARGYHLTFAIAYLRDLANKLGLLAETFETTVPWNKAMAVYNAVVTHAHELHQEHKIPGKPFISGRITQTYHSGVCIYFTYTICINSVENPEDIFITMEHSLRNVILKNGGSISHHHGIGKIRKDFMPEVFSPEAIHLIRNIKTTADPRNVFGVQNNIFAYDE